MVKHPQCEAAQERDAGEGGYNEFKPLVSRADNTDGCRKSAKPCCIRKYGVKVNGCGVCGSGPRVGRRLGGRDGICVISHRLSWIRV
jgi:hypothetical protein